MRTKHYSTRYRPRNQTIATFPTCNMRYQTMWEIQGRLVADGQLTKEPNETVYSGVVSLRNLRLAMFLAELNDLQLWDQMLQMHIFKHSQKRSSTLWLALNLKSYKDMLLLCTRHSIAQDLEENVGMTNSLTFFSRWTSNLQKQILTYG